MYIRHHRRQSIEKQGCFLTVGTSQRMGPRNVTCPRRETVSPADGLPTASMVAQSATPLTKGSCSLACSWVVSLPLMALATAVDRMAAKKIMRKNFMVKDMMVLLFASLECG